MSGSHAPSPEQQRVIDTWGQGMAIQAGAGSGKTTTLVTKCVKLLETREKARFAAVTFTERSATDLRIKLSDRLSAPGALNYNWVMTIHGLCGAIIKEYPREAGFDGEESILTEPEAQLLWESAVEALWLDEIPEEISHALDSLLDRESQNSLGDLLLRLRDIKGFGALEALKASSDPDTVALYRTGGFVLERYSRLKRRRGVLDFNDLELGADRALNHASVRAYYHRCFDLVLVDEFQDTNPIQARLIWKFARPEGTNLCVVGDPKQSIYRFRDADVTVFEEFCKRLPIQQSLTWNFRSRPGIIEYTNALCGKAFAVGGNVTKKMEFESLIPQREPHPDPELHPVVRVPVQSPNDLAHWIRGEMAKGIPLEDMALLVRRIRGNEKWFKALTANGIPIAVGSGGLFWSDPRVRELVAFLRWWDLPGHSLSGGIFLRAPWMRIPDLVLDQWVQQDPTWQAPFFASDHVIAVHLNKFRTSSAPAVRPGELLLELLVDAATEEELWAPLLGLWHRVEEYSSNGLDFHDTVQELTRAVEENRREREVPAPRNLGQLPVLTFHGAKGLEFPHVILIDFGHKPRISDAPLLFWDRDQGAFLGRRDEDGGRDKDDPAEAKWRTLEKEKNLAESKRLFYVALTRAKERLALVCLDAISDAARASAKTLTAKKEKDLANAGPEQIFKEDHWRNWIDTVDVPQSLPPLPFGPMPARPVVLQQSGGAGVHSLSHYSESVLFKRTRHSVTEWALLDRCPRAYEWTFIRPVSVPAIAVSEQSEVDSSSDSTELGTLVHSCLEKGDYSELNTQPEIQVRLTQWARTSPWMQPADPSQKRDVWKELPFEVPTQGETLVGSIDRLLLQWIDGLPHYSIIDFKVTQGPKSRARVVDAYRTQIELYAWAVRALAPPESQINARIVVISTAAVQEVPIPLGHVDIPALLAQSLAVISGGSGAGKPRPGRHCRVCPHEMHCPDSNTFVL